MCANVTGAASVCLYVCVWAQNPSHVSGGVKLVQQEAHVKIAAWWSEGLIIEPDRGMHHKHMLANQRRWHAKAPSMMLHHSHLTAFVMIFKSLILTWVSSSPYPPTHQPKPPTLSSLMLHPTPCLVMLLSALLGSVTGRCQFKSLGFSFRARVYMWMNAHVCPVYWVQHKNRNPREMVTVIANLWAAVICVGGIDVFFFFCVRACMWVRSSVKWASVYIFAFSFFLWSLVFHLMSWQWQMNLK